MPDAPRCTRISSRDSVNLAVVQLPMIVIITFFLEREKATIVLN